MNESRLNIDNMLEGGFHRMSHVYRYSSIPTMRKENVAEHSWYVAFYAYLIAKDLEARKDVKVDYGVLLARALLHDLDESHTGDFLRIVKYGHPDLKHALDEISLSMMQRMSHEVGINLIPDWEDAKHPDLEGQIVMIVDLARVVSYLMEEIRSGNQHIAHILFEVRDYFFNFRNEYDPEQKMLGYYAMEIAEYCSSHIKRLGLKDEREHRSESK